MAASAGLCRAVARGCAEAFGARMRALILTGSLARDEGTFERQENDLALLGDAELLLVFPDGESLPRPEVVTALARGLEHELHAQGLRLSLDLRPCHESYLRGMRPHIFAYELRACGRVLWGDPRALALVPAFATSDIPLDDAWMLLGNRLMEQLRPLAEGGLPQGRLSPALRYVTAKLWLDMATSFLVFVGGYAPTYRGRAQALASLASRSGLGEDTPVDLARFAERVKTCTRYKLEGGPAAALDGEGFWREAILDARRLWRWELSRLVGASAADRRLYERWMRRQPWGARARGWAFALRRGGWHRSWRNWPRWARLARTGSPRHWIYAAGAELLFVLAQPGSDAEAAGVSLRERRLPLDERRGTGWTALAAAIDHNYQELLVETRS